jgi:hypothetical protein
LRWACGRTPGDIVEDPVRRRQTVRARHGEVSGILFCVFVVLLMINFMSEQAGTGPEPAKTQGKCSGGLVERFGCYVDGLANNVAAFDPSNVERRFPNSRIAATAGAWPANRFRFHASR